MMRIDDLSATEFNMSAPYKIFAYGSLINEASLRKTVTEARNIIPAVTYGMRRVFNLASSYRFDHETQAPVCVLNAEADHPDSAMNGTCFEMDENSLHRLLERESSYDFLRIQAHRYQVRNSMFEAFYFRAKPANPYPYLANSTAQRHYLQLCLQGCAIFGQQFVADFKQSTSFWGIECRQTHSAIWEGKY